MRLVLDKWIHPYLDTSRWEHFDLGCKSRDNTNDKVLHDAVAAGKRIRAIFKEPTITPSQVQKEAMGLKKVASLVSTNFFHHLLTWTYISLELFFFSPMRRTCVLSTVAQH
jgi:isocitrate dehydrogenase